MYCPECHYEYEEDDTYCRHCGEDLTIASTESGDNDADTSASVAKSPIAT